MNIIVFRRDFIKLMLGVVMIIAPNFLFAENSGFWAVIKDDGVNVRTDSTISAPSVGKLYRDDKVYVISKLYEWYKIKLPRDVKAYLYRKYVKVNGDKVIVEANNLNIRSGPGINYPVLGQSSIGDVFKLDSFVSDEWVCVFAGDNDLYGWVHEKFVVPLKDVPRFNKTEKKSNKKIKTVRQDKPLKDSQVKGSSTDDRIIKDKKVSKKNNDLPIAKGIVAEVGRIFGKEYDFKLVDEKGKVQYYLSADKHTLSVFSGARVAVYGEVSAVSRDNKPVISVSKIERLR